MDYLESIEELKSELKLACNEFNAHNSTNFANIALVCRISSFQSSFIANKSNNEQIVDIGNDLELVFRSLLEDFLQETLTVPHGTVEVLDDLVHVNIIKLLKFSIEVGLHFAKTLPSLARIPFLLMEDLLENQTVQQAESTWNIVESLVDKITHPDLFSKGKLLVLKTCNSLLRKLSKSCHTEFCGRVLMFLAAIFPITERSAVNLSGKINVNKTTYFEDAEKYTATMTNLNSANDKVPDDNQLNHTISYEEYKSFWSLQSFYASEQRLFEPIPNSTSYNLTIWNQFLQNVKVAVELFDRFGYSEMEIEEGRRQYLMALKQVNKDTTTTTSHDVNHNKMEVDSNAMPEPTMDQDSKKTNHYSGNKFLTSSELFRLQLRDPSFRQQIATQLLIFGHSIWIKVLPTIESNDISATITRDLHYIHHHSCRIIEKTPPNGFELLETIKRVLNRECNWIKWKEKSCPSFEKEPVDPIDKILSYYQPSSDVTPSRELQRQVVQSILNQEVSSLSEIRYSMISSANPSFSSIIDAGVQKLSNGIGNENETVRERSKSITDPKTGKLRSFKYDISDENVKEYAKELTEGIPSLERQLEPYIEAEDPENGIEAEYHPKNDDVYCWRTRRFLANHHLSVFEVMHDGDIGKGLQRLKSKNNNCNEDESLGLYERILLQNSKYGHDVNESSSTEEGYGDESNGVKHNDLMKRTDNEKTSDVGKRKRIDSDVRIGVTRITKIISSSKIQSDKEEGEEATIESKKSVTSIEKEEGEL